MRSLAAPSRAHLEARPAGIDTLQPLSLPGHSTSHSLTHRAHPSPHPAYNLRLLQRGGLSRCLSLIIKRDMSGFVHTLRTLSIDTYRRSI